MMMNKADPSLKEKALQMYGECRLRNPFHWKAYQGGDPNVIRKLQVCSKQVHPFFSGKQRAKEAKGVMSNPCAEQDRGLHLIIQHRPQTDANIFSSTVVQHSIVLQNNRAVLISGFLNREN